MVAGNVACAGTDNGISARPEEVGGITNFDRDSSVNGATDETTGVGFISKGAAGGTVCTAEADGTSGCVAAAIAIPCVKSFHSSIASCRSLAMRNSGWLLIVDERVASMCFSSAALTWSVT